MLPSFFRFSTAALPERERLAMFREAFGRNLSNMDIMPLDENCWAEIELRALPSACIMWGTNSAHRFEMLHDRSRGSDELALLWVSSPDGRPPKRLTQVGKEVTLDSGMAVLTTCESPLSAVCASMPHHTTIKLDRSRLQPLLTNLDDALMRPIHQESKALRLLKSYVGSFREEQPTGAELEHAVVTHICDLIALAIGTDRDARELARGRGLSAARLDAAKRLILKNLSDQHFSVANAALAQGVTPRYVQMLFEREGTTFSAYLLERRLAWAQRRLSDPSQADRQIGTIALDAGFGDLSYFNRAFRRAYGETPSDVRYRTLRVDRHGRSRSVR